MRTIPAPIIASTYPLFNERNKNSVPSLFDEDIYAVEITICSTQNWLDNMNKNSSNRPYDTFRSMVYDLVRTIPEGRVMTYGGIAAKIAKPEGIDPLAYKKIRARWVGYAMKSCPQDVPWWRIVNREGKISLREGHGPYIQPELLKEEGVVIDEEGKIMLDKYLWIID